MLKPITVMLGFFLLMSVTIADGDSDESLTSRWEKASRFFFKCHSAVESVPLFRRSKCTTLRVRLDTLWVLWSSRFDFGIF